MKEKILAAIQLKYKNLGYTQKAIDAVVSYLEKSVTDESKIDESVDSVEGMLKAFQSEIDSRVNAAVEKAKKPVDPGKPDEQKKDDVPPADMPEWAKALLTQNKLIADKVAAMEQGKSAETRKSQLETTLKDAPEPFKNSILKAFARMQFATEEDFTGYLDEVKTDTATVVQDSANDGLGKNGRPFVPKGGSDKNQASKEEATSLVNSIMPK